MTKYNRGKRVGPGIVNSQGYCMARSRYCDASRSRCWLQRWPSEKQQRLTAVGKKLYPKKEMEQVFESGGDIVCGAAQVQLLTL